MDHFAGNGKHSSKAKDRCLPTSEELPYEDHPASAVCAQRAVLGPTGGDCGLPDQKAEQAALGNSKSPSLEAFKQRLK